jgi:uncharacterized protein YeaO (DUF488 family)
MKKIAMADLFNFSHSRSALAALVVTPVSPDILDAVKTRYNQGCISPTSIYLTVIQSPDLLTQDPDRAKIYARKHFALPDSLIIPCFYIVIDERTAQDGSVVYVQQDWPSEADNSVRTMPEHAYFLTTGFVLGDDEWERIQEEWQDEKLTDVYNPSFDPDSIGRIKSMVRFPASLAKIASLQESEDFRTCELESQVAEQLELRALASGGSRVVKQIRRADGTFGDNLFLEVYQKDIISPSDELRVWGTSDYFNWHIESVL